MFDTVFLHEGPERMPLLYIFPFFCVGPQLRVRTSIFLEKLLMHTFIIYNPVLVWCRLRIRHLVSVPFLFAYRLARVKGVPVAENFWLFNPRSSFYKLRGLKIHLFCDRNTLNFAISDHFVSLIYYASAFLLIYGPKFG